METCPIGTNHTLEHGWVRHSDYDFGLLFFGIYSPGQQSRLNFEHSHMKQRMKR